MLVLALFFTSLFTVFGTFGRVSAAMPVIIPPDNIDTDAGTLFMIEVYVQDDDDHVLHMTYDFGDGTPNLTFDSPPALDYPLLQQTHTWNPVPIQGEGNYKVNYIFNITADDGFGNVATASVPVSIKLPVNGLPNTPAITVPLSVVDPDDNVTIEASTSDPEGEPIIWTFIFNDSVQDFLTIVKHTSWTAPDALVTQNVSHVFGAPGNYSVEVYVCDRPGNQTFPHNVSQKSATIEVKLNRIPIVGAIVLTPPEVQINASIGFVNITYSVEIIDSDGDPLNCTWNFDDGTPPAYNQSVGGKEVKFSQWRVYNETGSHNISVVVTDGRPGHTVTVNSLVNITSTNNPPALVNFVFHYPSGEYALPNESIAFTLYISDPEQDSIYVTIDFGDGTVEYYNLTVYTDGNVTLIFNHTWSQVGSYVIQLNYTDNKQFGVGNHNISYNVTLDVKVPEVRIKKSWNWWDYFGLWLFSMIPVLVVLRFFMVARRRKHAEDKGFSLEDWNLLKSEQKKTDMSDNKKEGA